MGLNAELNRELPLWYNATAIISVVTIENVFLQVRYQIALKDTALFYEIRLLLASVQILVR